jgi:BASS family bile acid:Na+ symporter
MFGHAVTVAPDKFATTLIGGVLLPLAVGALIRRFAPSFAERIWSVVYKISLVLVLAAFVPIVIKVWPAMTAMIGDGTLLAMASITLIALASGHLLGGPDPRDRATLATAAAVRHPGIAMAIASASFHEPRVSAAILLFMVTGLVVATPYTMWAKRRAAPPSDPAASLHARR